MSACPMIIACVVFVQAVIVGFLDLNEPFILIDDIDCSDWMQWWTCWKDLYYISILFR